jgi:hypothetical protein
VLEQNMLTILAALVKKLGGTVHITPEEMQDAKDRLVVASTHPQGGVEFVVQEDVQQETEHSIHCCCPECISPPRR